MRSVVLNLDLSPQAGPRTAIIPPYEGDRPLSFDVLSQLGYLAAIIVEVEEANDDDMAANR
jgi:hypothetical protein